MLDKLDDKYIARLEKFKSPITKKAYKRFCFENNYNCACEYSLYKWANGIGKPSAANKEIIIEFFKSLDT